MTLPLSGVLRMPALPARSLATVALLASLVSFEGERWQLAGSWP